MDSMMLRTFLISLALAAPVFADPKVEAVAGQLYYVFDYDGASDFSGIAWTGGDQFYVVTNRANMMLPLKLDIDRTTGRIREHKFGSRIPLRTTLSDLEGIAWQPERERLYFCAESDSAIVGFDRDADARFSVDVPQVFRRNRQNKGLESLTFGAGAFWTANEGTLEGDGKPSGLTNGALVRVQKFDEKFKPLAQFAYRTDNSLVESATGLSELCALPDGGLLALERVMAVGLAAKIYRVDASAASDTTDIARLSKEKIKIAEKKLLFERHTATVNFEGIALGPELEGDLAGWRSLILISDSAGEHKHVIMPLRIKLTPTEEPHGR
jgi:Esterase-like activity of phytase